MARARRGDTHAVRSNLEQVPLELDEDLPFQRRERVARRIGTTALCGFLVAAALGLFGSGPLSSGTARTSDGTLTAQYERFTRVQASTVLHFVVQHREQDKPVVLRINSEFAQQIQIEQILPEPFSVASAGDHYLFEIASDAAQGPANIVVRYRPESLGSQLVIARAGEAEVRFRQFVYP